MARDQGHYLSRDGYHRSFGLLSCWINRIPAYSRDFGTTENLPLLRDYHDDRVAEPVLLPAQHRMIVIRALELLAPN